MSDREEIDTEPSYRQFGKAFDLLEDLIARIEGALQSGKVVDWRIPGAQLELARAYEALSRDEEVEAAFARAAEAAKLVNDGPTSEEFVQFALGSFYLRRRMYDRALAASQFVRDGSPSDDAWLLLSTRAEAYARLGLMDRANEAAASFVSASPNKDGAKRHMEEIFNRVSRKA